MTHDRDEVLAVTATIVGLIAAATAVLALTTIR
jgi:hypothetical protein